MIEAQEILRQARSIIGASFNLFLNGSIQTLFLSENSNELDQCQSIIDRSWSNFRMYLVKEYLVE